MPQTPPTTKVISRWFLPGLCVVVPLAVFALFTFVSPRPYYVFLTDIEPDYYYNARLVLDGKPTGLHHPGTLIYYLAAVVLKLVGPELGQTQHFFNLCYFIVALASIGGLLFFWKRLLQNLPLGIGALVLVLALGWPSWLSYSNYFGADSFTIALGLPVSALLWHLFTLPSPVSRRQLILAGAGLGLVLAVKMTFAPFAAAALGGIFVGQLLQPALPWTGFHGKAWLAIRKMLFLAIGLTAAFILGITPSWLKFLAIWYKTLQRPDAHVASRGVPAALAHAAGLLFNANPLLTLLFIIVTGLFIFTTFNLFRSKINPSDSPLPSGAFDARSAAAFLGLLLLSFIYCATTALDIDVDPGVVLRNLAPSALFFPLAALFCFQLRPSAATPKNWLTGPSWFLAILAVVTLLAGVYLENKSRLSLVEVRSREIAATKAGLQPYEVPGSRLAFWTSSGQNDLGEASFHFWGNYHYGDQLYYPFLQKEFPQLTFFQLRNATRIFLDEKSPPTTSAGKPPGRLKALWAQIKDELFSVDLSSPLDGGYFYEGIGSEKPGLIAFTASQMDDPSVRPLTIDGLEKILAETYGPMTVSHVKFGETEWLLFKPLPLTKKS